MKIGIMGGKGSFSDQVVSHFQEAGHVPKDAEKVYLYTTKGVLEAIEKNEVDIGTFATYNSRSLFVAETAAVIGHYRFDYVAQHTMPIQHNVMVKKGVERRDITHILGHREVITQCRGNLESKCTDIPYSHETGNLIDGSGIAEALVADELPDSTALIGSPAIAHAYDLETIIYDMADDPNNATTFLLVKPLTQ